ncbi:MAG TPA: hypothetical protein VNO13_04660 [Candidatus Udaeobacter sp.]|nr:hypothetical protein [Candidatus Udaeobacter sp.]
MKIPFDLLCDKCGTKLHADLDIATPNPDIVCTCGKTKFKVLVGSTGSESFPGLVLDRAWYELQNGDYTMTILLSAIAVETLLSVYAQRWSPLLALPRDVIPRISKICRELYPMGIENFIGQEHRVSRLVFDFRDDALRLFGHPRAIASKFYDAIFESRNAIVHSAKFTFSQDEATKAWNVPVFFYRVVRAMVTWKDYQIYPESLDSFFRKLE